MRFGAGLGYTEFMQVGLVGCVKKKAGTARAAEDLYTSTLFKDRRRYVERTCRRWFILSARHGLVDPATVLEPYDETLTSASRAARRTWSAGVLDQLAGQLGDLGVHSFEIHAGAAYRDFGLVSGLRAAGASVEIVGEGLPIGKLLSFYTNHERQLSPTRHRSTGVTPALPARRFATRAGPLTAYLESAQSPTTLTFDEIESLIGTALPPSARNHRAWWANSKDRTLARQWLAAGWRAESVDLAGGWIRLVQ
jgi:hypothetical protein